MILADGFEDIEAVAPIDILTRCGVEVTVAGLHAGPVPAAYGSVLQTDRELGDVFGLFDAVILPGGLKNARSLAAASGVIKLVQEHHEAGRLVASICASPSHVLGQAADILKDRRTTGDPGCNELLAASGAQVTDEEVTVDGNIITARGPGAAIRFGLAIGEYLVGNEIPDRLRKRWRMEK